MKPIVYALIFISLFGLIQFSNAQTSGKDFSNIDAYVKKLGSLDSMNMGTITGMVTKPYSDKTEKARAIFDWIAYNISFDCKLARTGNDTKNSTNDVLFYRKATAGGYAALFQDMCSSANIRCLIPDGFVKLNTESIDESKPDINHTWAVVQLGISPDEWFYVDPTWGSGTTDAEMKLFTRSFNDAYFFADKGIFNWQHYPDNEAWKLGPAPKSKGIFYALPLVKEAAYDLGLKKFNPVKGKLKVQADRPTAFSFTLDAKAVISKLTLTTGEIKKQKTKEITFSYSNGLLSFSNKFEEGEYPLTITVNGKALMTYAIVAE